MIIGAVDNGKKGGICFLQDGSIKSKFAMPVIKIKKKSKYNTDRIKEILLENKPDIVFIESAQAMPGQGVSSMFTIGLNYGLMQGICIGLGIPIEIVNPRKWQNEIFEGMNTENTKDCGYEVCKKLFPKESWLATKRSKVYHNGITDATCIALYGNKEMLKRINNG